MNRHSDRVVEKIRMRKAGMAKKAYICMGFSMYRYVHRRTLRWIKSHFIGEDEALE
jgi:hypothetical protein